MKREYGQYCGVAKALDLVGSRWTLLIVRELLPGPRRFKDLQSGLPGIGTNLLTDRLRHLESEGLVGKRTLPPPAGSTVYELTAEGGDLEEIVFALGRWGQPRLPKQRGSEVLHPRTAMVAMQAGHSTEAAEGIDETYEFRVDSEVFTAEVVDGKVRMVDGPAAAPDVVLETDADTFLALGVPGATEEALVEGRLRIEGSEQAIAHCREIFTPVGASIGTAQR